MNYSALIQNRKSTREFTGREVTYAQLETIQNYYYNSARRLLPEIRTELYCFGYVLNLNPIAVIKVGNCQSNT